LAGRFARAHARGRHDRGAAGARCPRPRDRRPPHRGRRRGMTKATLADWLDDLAARYGKREALVDGTRRWTYAELATATERIARGLVTVGVGEAPRIGILLPNRAERPPTGAAGSRP